MTKFGDKLHLLRTHHNLTLTQLSSLLGYKTHSYISEIEAGRKRPTAELVVKVSTLFGVTTDELLLDDKVISTDNSSLHPNAFSSQGG